MKTLALIPSRGGSKGIPLKNIKKLGRHPLLIKTISMANKAKIFDRIIVSTDNKQISQIAKKSGAEIPFLRPQKLSKDDTSIIDVVKHCLEFLSSRENYQPEIVMILQPTSPFRTTSMIKKAIKILESKNATSVLSVAKVRTHPYSSFWLGKKYLRPFKKNFTRYDQRQKYPSLFHPTGSIYVFWNNTIKKYNSIYGPRIFPLIVEDEILNLDIDVPFDLYLANLLIKSKVKI